MSDKNIVTKELTDGRDLDQPKIEYDDDERSSHSESMHLNRLAELCRESESLYMTASEHVQNRGVKLLLRAYACQRRAAANALEGQPPHVDEKDEGMDNPVQELRQGVVDIQAAMTVGRENRTHLVLEELLKHEIQLEKAYTDVLAHADLSEQDRTTVQRQAEIVHMMVQQLEWLQRDGYENLVVRLFDEQSHAERAIADLARQGFDKRYITLAKVDDLPVRPSSHEPSSGKTKNTLMAGLVTGSIVGVLIGLIVVAFQWFVPALSGMLGVRVWLLIIGGAAFGALFGAIFGALIGQSTREDDAFLVDRSLREGTTLLIVHANDSNIADVEEALQLHHERELNR